MTKKKEKKTIKEVFEEQTKNFIKGLSQLIYLSSFIFFIVMGIFFTISYMDYQMKSDQLQQEQYNLNYCKVEYEKLNNKYNNLVNKYNDLNSKIPIYENGLISCGFDLSTIKKLLN